MEVGIPTPLIILHINFLLYNKISKYCAGGRLDSKHIQTRCGDLALEGRCELLVQYSVAGSGINNGRQSGRDV